MTPAEEGAPDSLVLGVLVVEEAEPEPCCFREVEGWKRETRLGKCWPGTHQCLTGP